MGKPDRYASPVTRIGAPLAEIISRAAETSDEEFQGLNEVVVPKEIEKVVEKEPDPAIGARGDLVRHVAGHVDAMGQLARIVEVPVVGEPNLSGFQDALETAHVGVMIKSLRNRTVVLLGQQMPARPFLVCLDRLLKLRWQRHTAVVGRVGFRHGIAVRPPV